MARLSRLLTLGGLVSVALLAGAAGAVPAAKGVLPPSATVSGWKQVGAARLYTASNLFDLIDGEAEAILAYDFVQCAHGEYAAPGQAKPTLTVDVFQMRDDLNAFGVFGSDRQSGRSVGVGVEGVKIGSSGLNFWKGPFVVRCTIIKVDAAHTAALEAFARAAANRITAPLRMPAQVLALPEGRQSRSEKYVRSGVGGQSYITNAVTARYPSAGFGAEVFIATYPQPGAASAAFEQYRLYETKNGTGLKAQQGIGDAAFAVVDRYAKNVAVTRKGKYVAGVLRAKDQPSALKLLQAAVKRLP